MFGQRREQVDQVGGRFEQDRSAEPVQHREVTRKLDHVAIALLGDDQQTLAAQRFAVPARFAVAAMAQRGHVDTRLVVFPTFREVSVEKQGEAAVIARQRRLVRQVRRRPEGFGGGFGIAEVILRFAEPVPGVCDRRILVDGTIEASPRPRGVAEAE